MAEITLVVPDENCKGCDFLAYSSYKSSYQCYQERYYCQIFKCNIANNKKCLSCKLLSTRKGGAE